MNRAAIYVHFEKNGHVPKYVLHCLTELKKECARTVVVVNGELTTEGHRKLKALKTELIHRPNEGFDFWGYKAGIEHIGYKELAKYDELLLTNNSYYGPIFPFTEIFKTMSGRDFDFWGINRSPRKYRYVLGPPHNIDARVYPHLQSFWLAIRRPMLTSPRFKKYWDTLPRMEKFMDAVLLGEVKFTHYFETRGFRSGAFINTEKYEFLIRDNFVQINEQEVIDDRCPIVKKKYFSTFRKEGAYSTPHRANKLMDFLKAKNQGLYEMIWDDLLASTPGSELSDTLAFNRILPSDVAKPIAKKPKTALVIYVYYEDLLDYVYSYISKMPEWVNFIVVSPHAAVLKAARKKLARMKNKKAFLTHTNRGREQSAFLITCRHEIEKHDYVGIVHAKRSEQVRKTLPHIFGIYADDFNEHCFQSLVKSGDYVNNIMDEFESDSRLGMLVPFTFNQVQSQSVGNEWFSPACHENSARYLNEMFKIHVPVDPHPMAPFGGMFWARTRALKTLFSHNWKFSDFPAEPFQPGDCSALPYCLERMFPILAQNDGFYTAFTAPEKYARGYIGDLYSFSRTVKIPMYRQWGYHSDSSLAHHLSVTLGQGPAGPDTGTVADILRLRRLKFQHILKKIIWKYFSTGDKRARRKERDDRLKARILSAKRAIWAARKPKRKKS